MRSFDKSDEYDIKELEQLNAEQWMVDCLKMNPDYPHWGPYEDYMCVKTREEGGSGGWNARAIFNTWKDFGPWGLDALNEIVNFYFEINRGSKDCLTCESTGLNQETKKISDEWYSFDKQEYVYLLGREKRYNKLAHSHNITQTEVDALWEAGRLKHYFKEKPTPEQVNEWSKTGMGHDAINQHICVKARANELGVYGFCGDCGGRGYIYTEPSAKLGLVLWFIHPRKGCSRGVHVKEIKNNELTEVVKYLQESAERNAARFSKIS